MVRKVKSFLGSQTVALSLCAIGIIVIIAILLSVEPVSQKSVYKPGAPAGPYSRGLASLALDESRDQPAAQSNMSWGAAPLGIGEPDGMSGSGGSVQPAGPAVSSPVYNPPVQPPAIPPSSEPDFFFPIDPNPCKKNLSRA